MALGTVHQSTINSFELLQLKDIKVYQLVKTVVLWTPKFELKLESHKFYPIARCNFQKNYNNNKR